MSILCLEGPSAVGKTTVGRLLEEKYDFERVPEVNELFERPANESNNWYLEQQVKRWGIARRVSSSGRIAILDGDPFQPIWYNWTYSNEGIQPVDEVMDYFEEKIRTNAIGFPNQYILLSTSLSNLRTRKESDPNRARRGFDKHLELIDPLNLYFNKLNAISEGLVSFVESNTPEDVAERILAMAAPGSKVKSANLFEGIRQFIEGRQ